MTDKPRQWTKGTGRNRKSERLPSPRVTVAQRFALLEVATRLGIRETEAMRRAVLLGLQQLATQTTEGVTDADV